MPDMLVKLYDLPEIIDYREGLAEDIKIKRAMAPDFGTITRFIQENFGEGWAYENQKALFNTPTSCYIAVRNKEILGFACYDATALGFFGPIGVAEKERKSGVGKALMLRCILSMREKGYGYAIVGWVGPAGFYEKILGATLIEETTRGVYRNMLKVD